jgi:hypothetical protein
MDQERRGPGWVLLGLVPLLGLGVLLALIVLSGAGVERKDAPPVEDRRSRPITPASRADTPSCLGGLLASEACLQRGVSSFT